MDRKIYTINVRKIISNMYLDERFDEDDIKVFNGFLEEISFRSYYRSTKFRLDDINNLNEFMLETLEKILLELGYSICRIDDDNSLTVTISR